MDSKGKQGAEASKVRVTAPLVHRLEDNQNPAAVSHARMMGDIKM